MRDVLERAARRCTVVDQAERRRTGGRIPANAGHADRAVRTVRDAVRHDRVVAAIPGQFDRQRSVEHQRPEREPADAAGTGRQRRAGIDGQLAGDRSGSADTRCGSRDDLALQRRVDLQRAAGDQRHAKALGGAAAQNQRSGSELGQRGATDAPGQRHDRARVGGNGRSARAHNDLVVYRRRPAHVQRRAVFQRHLADAQVAVAVDGQRSGADRGRALVAVVAVEHRGHAPGLDEVAAAADRSGEERRFAVGGEGQRMAAEIDRRARHAANERADRRVAGERQLAAVDKDLRAGGKRVAAVDAEFAGTDRGFPGVAVGARQRQRTAAGLDERAAAADDAAEDRRFAAADGQRRRAEQYRSAARQRTNGLRCVDDQGRTAQDGHATAVGERRTAGDHQRPATTHRGIARVTIVAGQRQRSATDLAEAAAARDRSAEGARTVVHADLERVAVERDRADARQSAYCRVAAQRERRARSDLDAHRGEIVRVAGGQRSGADREFADFDAACQRQRPGAGLGQRPVITGDLPGQRRRRSGGHFNRRVDLQRDRVVYRRCPAHRQLRAVVQRQRAAAQVGVAGDGQRSVVDRGRPGIAVGSRQRQRSAAALGERAAAVDYPGERQRRRVADHRVAGERDRVVDDRCRGDFEVRSRRQADLAAAEVGVAGDGQHSGRDGRSAVTIAVGAGERQRAAAGLDQAAGAADDARQRQPHLGVERHHPGQLNRVAYRQDVESDQRRSVRQAERALAEPVAVADRQRTGVDAGCSREFVDLRELKHPAAGLDQIAGAVDDAVQRDRLRAGVDRRAAVERDGVAERCRRADDQRRRIAQPDAASERAAGGDGELSAVDADRAVGVVDARKRQRAAAGLGQRSVGAGELAAERQSVARAVAERQRLARGDLDRSADRHRR